MKNTAIKLTAFTVLTIVMTFWLATVIGKLAPFDDSYEVQAVFSDATGILNGDPVRIAGVPVGKVTGFEVSGGEAVITLAIDTEVELPDNAIFEIRYLNLLGQRVVEVIRPDVVSAEPLRAGDRVPVTQTRPALDLSIVFNNLRPLIRSTDPEDINTVARAVLEVFEGREQDLAGVLGNVGSLADMLAGREQRLARLVTGLERVTRVLNEHGGGLRTGLREFTGFMEGLAGMTPEIESVVERLDAFSSRLGGVLTRNRANLESELRDLATILGVVRDNLGPLDRVAKNLKEVLLATARSQSYGRWWNLYIVNFCGEPGAFGADLPTDADCTR